MITHPAPYFMIFCWTGNGVKTEHGNRMVISMMIRRLRAIRAIETDELRKEKAQLEKLIKELEARNGLQ